jgi:HD-GYP domain-containing protein (c-di-GMP phosphodiesterase class II)
MTEPAVLAFVGALTGARKAFSLYPATHPQHREALDALVTLARELAAAGPLTLNMRFGRLYHDSTLLASEAPGVRSLAECLDAHRVESITFFGGVSERDLTELVGVLSLRPEPDLDVASALADRGVVSVSVQRLSDELADELAERERKRAADHALYQRLVGAMRELVGRVGASGAPDLRSAGAIVEGVLARFMDDSAAVLGLAATKSPTEADVFHALNTMIYALTIGAGLALPADELASLGVAALLHDIGKVAFDREDPAEREQARLLHPRVGAEILARVSEGDRLAMLVAYEHHMGASGKGWPEAEPGFVAHPYSRIVAVADRYDRLTTAPPDGAGLTPDRAMVQLLKDTQRGLDVTFARVFVREMGVFPVGSMVRLSDQSVGVVCAPGPNPLQPTVRVIYGADGLPLEGEPDVDLTGSGLEIIEVIRPEDLRETVAQHL